MIEPRAYDPKPHYPPVGQRVCSGWRAAASELPDKSFVLALDGPAVLGWDAVVTGLTEALSECGQPVRQLDLRTCFAPWSEVLRRTASPELTDDPVFARIATGALADLFDGLPRVERPAAGVQLVFGPGAALVEHDVLWYADLPKRYAEAAITSGSGLNIGQPPGSGSGSARRLFYIDWPLLDRHRDLIAPAIDRWIDTQQPDRPASIDGVTLRATIAALADRPFRTQPTFNTTPWGGHWAQRRLGFNPASPNTALGYELIAPESGVLVGEDGGPVAEVPFQLIVALQAPNILGDRVHERFGTSFPIRFDYLDTFDGGNLSVHCHPRADYMSKVFGWPYTQHESYYVMLGGAQNKVFLGLHGDVDVDAFHRQAHSADQRGQPFDIEEFVQTFPAEAHRLFLIPAGTPHGSGAGNVVLEVSATPYLYSLRFYDWLRRDRQGSQRAVHVEHAFRNLDVGRLGAAVARDLLQAPRILRTGAGWCEELLGSLPEMFFEVRRLVIDADSAAHDDAGAGFHVLNVVEGDGVLIETATGHRHSLVYAETLVVPAAVGAYTLQAVGRGRARVVKALVR